MRRAAFLLGFLLLASSAAAQFNTIWGGVSGQFTANGVGYTRAATIVVAASNSKDTTHADYLCTGTADQTCIQAAINALPATGGKVLLLDGTFNTTAAITTKYGLWLQGSGRSTILKAATGATRDIITLQGYASDTSGNEVTISDFTIDANALTNMIGIDLWAYGVAVTNPRIERMVLKNGGAGSYLLYSDGGVAGVTNILVRDSYFTTCGDSCIEVKCGKDILISGNSIVSGGVQFYASATVYGLVLSGNVFDNGSILFTPNGGSINGVDITDNLFHISGTSSAHLEIHEANAVTVSGNVFDSSSQTAASGTSRIWVLSVADGATIMSSGVNIGTNSISLGTAGSGVTSYPGIAVNGGTSVTVHDNIISSPGTTTSTGILANAAVTGLSILNNRITGAGAGASRVGISLANQTGAGVRGNALDTLATGISVAATCSATRIDDDNTYSTVTVPLSMLDTTPANGVLPGTLATAPSVNTTREYRVSWTNADVVALGANLTGSIVVATLPTDTVVKNAYVMIGTAATNVVSLTVSVGRTAAAYVDYIKASNAMAAANTVYGAVVGDRGTNLTGYDLPSHTGTTAVYMQFICNANLNTVLTSTGTIVLITDRL